MSAGVPDAPGTVLSSSLKHVRRSATEVLRDSSARAWPAQLRGPALKGGGGEGRGSRRGGQQGDAATVI